MSRPNVRPQLGLEAVGKDIGLAAGLDALVDDIDQAMRCENIPERKQEEKAFLDKILTARDGGVGGDQYAGIIDSLNRKGNKYIAHQDDASLGHRWETTIPPLTIVKLLSEATLADLAVELEFIKDEHRFINGILFGGAPRVGMKRTKHHKKSSKKHRR